MSEKFPLIKASRVGGPKWAKEAHLADQTKSRVKRSLVTVWIRSVWQRRHVVTLSCRLHFLSVFLLSLSLQLQNYKKEEFTSHWKKNLQLVMVRVFWFAFLSSLLIYDHLPSLVLFTSVFNYCSSLSLVCLWYNSVYIFTQKKRVHCFVNLHMGFYIFLSLISHLNVAL